MFTSALRRGGIFALAGCINIKLGRLPTYCAPKAPPAKKQRTMDQFFPRAEPPKTDGTEPFKPADYPEIEKETVVGFSGLLTHRYFNMRT